ncbi:MAG TPA: RNA 3'-terminal phosphate cyclase [Planctomycetota bacterium]|nr:RNA 3'-terminal phosphate cyclase [Planctomycetota bacterium]
MGAPFEIDGSRGEGGGQVLRTGLALALATGRPLRVRNVRAGRPKPGLLRQHLAALRAAAEISGARMAGDELGSDTVELAPGPVRAGDYRFAVGSAGSTTLVLQTVLLPLALCGGSSRVRVEGGTHNRAAPPFEFLERSYVPILRRMGFDIEARLVRAGYEPAGGGEIEVRIGPAGPLRPLELCERGEPGARAAQVRIANLPARIAEDERDVLARLLEGPPEGIELVRDDAALGPGNVVSLCARFGEVEHVFTSFGQVGVPARRVAQRAVRQLRRFLVSDAAVDEHLADQLLLPIALGAGGRFKLAAPSSHTRTNLELLADWGAAIGLDAESGTIECAAWSG